MGLRGRHFNRYALRNGAVREFVAHKGNDNRLIAAMRVYRTILLLGAAVLVLSLTTACSARQNTRGNLPTKDQVELVTPGVHRREDVRTVLGAPSVISTFDDSIWYYIGRRTSQYAFFKRNVIEQQVLIVDFDGDGPVRKISRLDKSNGREIEIVERETPSAGRELGLLEQLFGNIGRFAGDGTGP